MTEEERTQELNRLNEECRQTVFRLHRGDITHDEFVAQMEILHLRIRLTVDGDAPAPSRGNQQ